MAKSEMLGNCQLRDVEFIAIYLPSVMHIRMVSDHTFGTVLGVTAVRNLVGGDVFYQNRTNSELS